MSWKKHRLALLLEGPLQFHLRNYLGSTGSLLAYLQKQVMQVLMLALSTQNQGFFPGNPDNAVSDFAKVLVRRNSHKQKTSTDPICREE